MRYMAVMAGVATLLAATPAFADDWDFILTNDTGKEVKTIEVSPTGAAKWQPNKVDADVQKAPTLKPAARTTVHFSKDAECKFDIRLTFADDSNAVWTNINVCDNSYVTLRYKNGAPVFAVN